MHEVSDPGHCPPFQFIPTKVQLMKIVLKAAYFDGNVPVFVRRPKTTLSQE